jgi:hypothetical protein
MYKEAKYCQQGQKKMKKKQWSRINSDESFKANHLLQVLDAWVWILLGMDSTEKYFL